MKWEKPFVLIFILLFLTIGSSKEKSTEAVPAFSGFSGRETAEKCPRPLEDERIARLLQEITAEKKLTEDNFSFFYHNMDTNAYFFWNPNKWVTAASTMKVPIAMTYYDKIKNGDITENTRCVFSGGTYQLQNQGNSTGKQNTVESLIRKMIVNSDNTATDMLSIALGGRKIYKKQYVKYTDEKIPDDFCEKNIISAAFGHDIMMYLYQHSADYERILQYMKEASPGKRLKKYLIGCEAASKYGTYNGYVHDYGIVYGETTYIIGVFTKDVIGAEELIAYISKRVFEMIGESSSAGM